MSKTAIKVQNGFDWKLTQSAVFCQVQLLISKHPVFNAQ